MSEMEPYVPNVTPLASALIARHEAPAVPPEEINETFIAQVVDAGHPLSQVVVDPNPFAHAPQLVVEPEGIHEAGTRTDRGAQAQTFGMVGMNAAPAVNQELKEALRELTARAKDAEFSMITCRTLTFGCRPKLTDAIGRAERALSEAEKP